MNRITYTLLMVFTFFFVKNDIIQAQILKPLSQGNQAIYTSFGFNPAIMVSIGYAQGIYSEFLNRQMIISSEIASPMKLDFQDYRLTTGLQTSIFTHHNIDCALAVSFIIRSTENSVHSLFGFGADVILISGYIGKRWSLMGELGFDKEFVTHIKHSDWYKTYFYSDVKDGWYGNTAGNFHYGFRTSFSIAKFEIIFRAGIQKTESFNDLIIPVFGTVGVNYRF